MIKNEYYYDDKDEGHRLDTTNNIVNNNYWKITVVIIRALMDICTQFATLAKMTHAVHLWHNTNGYVYCN